VDFPAPLSWLNKRAMKKKSLDLLAQTGIKIGNLNQIVASMSGGQRQCVAISRAAGWGSKLIVMDEPTAALGIQETKKVEEIIINLKDRNIPVIIISHNLRQVFNLVDKIAVFRQGRIIDIVRTNEVSGNDVVALITGLDKKNKEVNEYI
jgi:fructose transport system ATP-binding protein